MQEETSNAPVSDDVEMQSSPSKMEENVGLNSKRKVVIAMDESKDSYQALDFYVSQIRQETDEVTALYCVHHKAHHEYESRWMPVDPKIVVYKYHQESEKGKELCKRLQEKLDTYQISGKVVQLEGGDPGHSLVKKVHDMNADLMVVGCRGHNAIRRKLLGSVSEYVLDHVDIPVIVCRH